MKLLIESWRKFLEEEEILAEKCWDGYRQAGLKKKGDRMVPNCVPVGGKKNEAVEGDLSDCPEPTQNPEINAANKQKAAEDPEIQYGFPEKMIAEGKRCGGCAAFNVSENMVQCGGAAEDHSVGYCMMHEFTCAAKRSCLTWAPGGPKTEDSLQEELLNEKCWPGYEKKGMKTMFGKKYPNCVKKKK